MAEKYPLLSPYNYCADNPIMLIDPNGMEIDLGNLYDKEKGEYKYKQQIKAFEIFASTKAGRSYILARAQKGFKLDGVFVEGLSIEAKADGSKHAEGIDVKFVADDKVPDHQGANTGNKLTDGNSRLEISINLWSGINADGDKPDRLLELARNIGHEVFYHGDYYEKRFTKLKKGNVSLHKKYGNLWTAENYNHELNLSSTKWGQIGNSYLRNAENVIKGHNNRSSLFAPTGGINTHRKAYDVGVWKQLNKRLTSGEIREYHRYGLPNNK